MRAAPTCPCLLCQIEAQLTAELVFLNRPYEVLLRSSANGMRSFASPGELLSHLKAARAGPANDDLYRELLAARTVEPQLVEMLMILAFTPVLHGTVRRIAKRQTNLARADIVQQALRVFLEVLRSGQLGRRQTHLAFAISRAVKRKLFAWAAREGSLCEPPPDGDRAPDPADDDGMQRNTLLRHFLHRCFLDGHLRDRDLELLVQIKLDGSSGEEVAASRSTTSNAIRQRMKRLLAKLRRLAGSTHATTHFPSARLNG